jgi:hypothetical protein
MRLASPDHYAIMGFTKKGEGSTRIVPFSLTKHLAASIILQEVNQLEVWVACN